MQSLRKAADCIKIYCVERIKMANEAQQVNILVAMYKNLGRLQQNTTGPAVAGPTSFHFDFHPTRPDAPKPARTHRPPASPPRKTPNLYLVFIYVFL